MADAIAHGIAGPCAEILEKTDDWYDARGACAETERGPVARALAHREKRNSALIALQALFEEHRNSANIAASFTADVFRQLKLPLQRTVARARVRSANIALIPFGSRYTPPPHAQLKDLRSTIAREACKVLEILSEVTGDTMRPLVRELLPTLLDF